MNKRRKKKKLKYESNCEKIWGYVMTYAELKEMKRSYHETVIVQHNYRNISDFADIEEFSTILGVPFEKQENIYNYPNRFRFRTLRKTETNRIHTVVQ